ncbi:MULTISPECIES: superoxide dismutase [Pedobacter]|uniref:Superoxide dismutase n=1 Tax=Pedobacter heparinus (strain ATCC 13125 / DSM 2366 / CIP 104194 / JCM 7457 / NBRC 12017 / NCIMB 9290 / NRRL B-14731 / HIM 762-3) TaxID=485917 RepID=C6Y243_PEDHD|nr:MULTISPECIES: superoxide dismutase [Pedobacter]ACU03036.1 Superoxide dismutase [Pedobacter heparinus DSM 2366]MBB5438415.1 Fe-Mn family superoxide dismutase [Pedobacter sp. AK017]
METNTRRNFIKNTLTASLAVAIGTPVLLEGGTAAAAGLAAEEKYTGAALKFTQLPLKYAYNALEPNIDALTMEIHYTKHHTAYIKNVNDAIAAENIPYATEKEFFDNASKLSAKARNNGGGAWNHNFFFETLKSGPSAGPQGKLKAAIDKTFGSYDKFKEQFSAAAASRFGSGWAWLVNDKGTLKITSTANQDNPLFDNAEVKGTPLLGLDVWEHAYYLKYQNKRPDYISNWWNVVDWDVVAKRLK